MRGALLTLAATCAMVVGGLTFADTAEARPWGYYAYRAPVRYYRPYYRPYYGYRSYYGPRYYSYPRSYYGTPYIGGRVYFRYY